MSTELFERGCRAVPGACEREGAFATRDFDE